MPHNADIYAGYLVDGSGEPFKEGMYIRIKNGFIDRVEPADPAILEKPGIRDLSRKTVLPSLVDGHVHLFMSGTTDPKARQRQLEAGFDEAAATIAENLEKHRSCGIGAVRDAGDRNGRTLCFKKNRGRDLKVALHAAGAGWHARGRYGKLIARSPSKNETLAQAILKKSKTADHVKIIHSGLNSLATFSKETPPQFDLCEMKQAVAAAKALHLETMVHSNGKLPTKIAIDAGCRSIEHGFFMGARNLKKMADAQVTWVPTVCPMNSHYEHLLDTGQPVDVVLRTLEHQLDQMRMARDLGVTVAMGTDAGSPGADHGTSMKKEFKLFLAAGFKVEEAVKAATLNGARLMGLAKEGRVARGMTANIIAVPGSPSDLPDTFDRVERL